VNVIRLMNKYRANVSVTITIPEIDYARVIINMAITIAGRRIYDTITFNVYSKKY